MTITRTFVPWYRAGFATPLAGAPVGSAARASLSASITLRGLGSASAIPAQLAGPGDVIGLDPREISRTEPYTGCTDFEPSYFAYVELGSADLPWRFSPFGSEATPLPDPEHPPTTVAQDLVRPWLMLVVVPASLATLSGAPPGGLPVLSTDAAQLPDPGEAWAWAHVQVVTTDGQRPQDALGDPSRSLARLVCPQRLAPSTRYLACLVPTFAAGRAALVTGVAAAPPLGPAWSGTGPTQLPVYFQWSFTTGEGGSFETFARRLKPSSAPVSMGGRVIAMDHPGWGATGKPGATVLMQGALRPFGASEAPPDATLDESIRGAISTSGGGVQLRPPLYGQDYQGSVTAIPAGASGWLARLNTDPRRRVAAGLAAWAVAVEQEDLVDRAWQQLSQSRPATHRPTRSGLGMAVGGSLAQRHQVAALAAAPPALARFVRAGGPASPIGAAAAGLAASVVQQFANPAPMGPPVQAPVVSATRFTPVFSEPAYTFLRAIAAEWLLPGAGDIPAESILLVRSNPSFVESFIIGLNHALARELVWRRFPLEPTGTMFANFWTSSSTGGTEFPPLAGWAAASDLGTHSSSPDQLVLLLRGALLRRFPTAAIYLSRTHPDGSEIHLAPNLSGSLGTDLAFFGFPLTPQEALRPTDAQPAGTSGWSIVIQEAVHHARFGVEDPAANARTLTSWQDLDWANGHLKGHGYVPVGGPLRGVSRPISTGATSVATWGLSSGHMAVTLQRPTFRVRIPVALWLSPLTSGG